MRKKERKKPRQIWQWSSSFVYFSILQKKPKPEKRRKKLSRRILFHPKITRPFVPHLSASSFFKSPLTYIRYSLSLFLSISWSVTKIAVKKGGKENRERVESRFLSSPGARKRWFACVYQADISKCRAVYQVFRWRRASARMRAPRRGHGKRTGARACIESTTTSLNLHNKASRGRVLCGVVWLPLLPPFAAVPSIDTLTWCIEAQLQRSPPIENE